MYVCTRIESDLAIAVHVTTRTQLCSAQEYNSLVPLLLHVTVAVYVASKYCE